MGCPVLSPLWVTLRLFRMSRLVSHHVAAKTPYPTLYSQCLYPIGTGYALLWHPFLCDNRILSLKTYSYDRKVNEYSCVHCKCNYTSSQCHFFVITLKALGSVVWLVIFWYIEQWWIQSSPSNHNLDKPHTKSINRLWILLINVWFLTGYQISLVWINLSLWSLSITHYKSLATRYNRLINKNCNTLG